MNTLNENTRKPILNLWRDAGEFAQAYVEAALWSSNTSSDDDTPLDRDHNWTDIDEASLSAMIADCDKFQKENDLTGYHPKYAGHDFWLTRNGHGAGFWENDYGTEAQCEALTKAADAFGECYLYLGDDGKIYLE